MKEKFHVKPELARPPRFNFRISDFVYIANGDGDVKSVLQDACPKCMKEIYWPERIDWVPEEFGGPLEKHRVLERVDDLRKAAEAKAPPVAPDGAAILQGNREEFLQVREDVLTEVCGLESNREPKSLWDQFGCRELMFIDAHQHDDFKIQ